MTGKLIEVRENHRFEFERLADYIIDHKPELGPLLKIEQFAGGQSNPTFLLHFEHGAKSVLRKKPPGKLLPSAHLIEREYRIQQALFQSDVPVPQMQLLCEDPEVIGTSFYLMAYLDGQIIMDVALPELNAAQRSTIYDQSVSVLAALHRVDYAALGLADFGKSDQYLKRQIERWSKQYQATKTDEIVDMDKLGIWLLESIPTDSQVTIAHGDYRLGNQIYSHDHQLIAILDWELSTLGDPLADLAYHCIPYDMPAGNPTYPGLQGLGFTDTGIPDESAYVAAYCRYSGREEIANWPFYMAFSYFRLASICQGVYFRGLQGNASDSKAMMYGQFAKMLAGIGVRRAGL